MGLGVVQSLSSYRRLPPINSHYMPEITALIENEDYGKVIPQLELASSIDPADTEKNKQLLTKVCSVAAQSLIKSGRFKDAIIQYDRAYRASPDSIDVQNNLAWILATCPDKALRDAPARSNARRTSSPKYELCRCLDTRHARCRLCRIGRI